jgi:hypothetical protein
MKRELSLTASVAGADLGLLRLVSMRWCGV